MRSLLIVLVMAITTSSAQADFPQLLSGTPSSSQRQKLELFGQFVGSWKFDGLEFHDDGKRVTDKGEIHFHWILGGRAIQDVWIETDRSDSEPKMYGTTVRYYNAEQDSWSCTWIEPQFGVTRTLTGRKIGDEIVLTSQLGDGTPIHWIFSDISVNSFRWRGEKKTGDRWKIYEDLRVERVK